jgi:hypothetical protein
MKGTLWFVTTHLASVSVEFSSIGSTSSDSITVAGRIRLSHLEN